jgi:KaiC/GvpD/RAD55 family RecA-like ATPase
MKRPERPPPFRRLQTGIPQLDVVLRGGLLEGGSYIV